MDSWCSFGVDLTRTPTEELGEGLKELKRMSTPRPKVPTNLEPWEQPEIKPQTKQHTRAGPRPRHICSRGLACLASVIEEASDPIET